MASKAFSIFGFILCIAAAVFIVLAFSTPYWLEPDNGLTSVALFDRLGLWEVCFRGYSDYQDGSGRIFNGCWWIFARQYDTIRKWLLPSWFVTTQALMTIALTLVLLGVLFGLLLLIGCFPEKMKKWITATLALGHYSIGIMVVIALIYFGTNAEVSRTWLRQASYRHLSWSFYLAVIGGLIALLSGMCYTVHYMKIRKSGRSTTAYRAHEMRHYRHERRAYY